MSRVAFRTTVLFGLFWTVTIAGFVAWEVFRENNQAHLLARLQARTVFQQIVATRAWNAGHLGVYVPVTNDTRPNPYLDHPHKNLQSDIGKLTMINPAFMTRQIAEIVEETGGVSFHITSRNPIRPGNAPDTWEQQALQSFESGKEVVFQQVNSADSGAKVYRYMAPLKVKESCLPCHAKQGYSVGEIRGGISVTLDARPFLQTAEIGMLQHSAVHGVVWLIGLVGIGAAALVVSRKQAHLAAMNVQLEHLATTDRLTRTYNRLKFEEIIEHEKAHFDRYGEPLSAVLLDVDDFKTINDTYGHKVGDEVLKELAALLQNNIRKADYLFRWGGEEFFVLFPRTSIAEAVVIAEKLRALVEEAEFTQNVQTTLSLGVSTHHQAESEDQLIRRADQAMYAAKKAGGNRVEVAESAV